MERIDARTGSLGETRSGIRISLDPRVVRTRQAILDAVESLVVANEALSVAAIVRTAGIGRSSFYTHFSGIDELAVVVLDNVFTAIGSDDLELRRAHTVTGAEAARRSQERLVAHLAEHRGLYASVLALPFSPAVFARAVEGYASQVRATIAMLSEVPPGISPDAVAIYTASGSLGLLAGWISAKDPVPPDELVDQLMSLLPSWLTAP